MTTPYWARQLAKPVATFARATVGYDDNGSNAIDVARRKTVALVGTSDGAIPAAEGHGGQALTPRCHNGTYLFGIDITNSHLHKSADGVTWDVTGLSTTALAGELKALSDGTLLHFRTPGTFADHGSSGTSVANSSGVAQLTHTGGFSGRSAGDVIYVLFASGYTSGFYKIKATDAANTATITTMADADVAYSADAVWTMQVSSPVTDGATVDAGHPIITKASTFYFTGQRVYCAFAHAGYADGYYRIRVVSSGVAVLQTDANPAVDLTYAADDHVAFVLCAACLRSTDNGASFSVSYFSPSMKMTTYPAISPYVSSFQDPMHQHGNTIIVSEYGTAGTALAGRLLHRSTDGGLTWAPVADLQHDAATLSISGMTADGHHWHAVGYHEGTGKWVAGFGDGSTVTGIATSSDDGLTWSLLIGNGNSPCQPIAFLDTGDATRILAGGDDYGCLYWINMTTGYVTPVFTSTDPLITRYFCFTLHKYAGVYYAGGMDAQTNHAPCLWVSTDLVNWSVYHKFAVADACEGFAAGFAGAAGGKLHYAISYGGVLSHFAISPANVRNVGGTLITPAVTNILTANGSSFETDVTELTCSTADVAQSHDPFVGTHGLVMTSHAPDALVAGSHTMQSAAFALTNAKSYVLSFRAKSVKPLQVQTQIYKGASVLSAATHSYFTVGTAWKQFVTSPFTANESVSTYTFCLNVSKLTEAMEFHVDAVMVKELPVAEFALGGTAQAADILTETITTPAEWTDIFAVQTLGQHTHYANDIKKYLDHADVVLKGGGLVGIACTGHGYADGSSVTIIGTTAYDGVWTLHADSSANELVITATNTAEHIEATVAQVAQTVIQNIKTWKVGDDELLLYYNVTNRKFYIQRNAETAVASAAQEWHPSQVIKFALRSDAAGLTLDIQNGRAASHIHDSALAALLSASMDIIYGDLSSANQFPGVYFDATMQRAEEAGIGFIPFKLTDAEVVAALNLKPTVGVLRTARSNSLAGNVSNSLYAAGPAIFLDD